MSCAPGWNWGSMEEFWKRNLILQVISGSRAYGLARAGSDEDTRGVCIPPKEYLLGLQTFEQHENETQDHVVFALAKFVRLALQANPNIIETLYTHGKRLELFARRPRDGWEAWGNEATRGAA